MRDAVLIVDDVADLLHLMEEAVALVLPSHEVFTAASGTAARNILTNLEAEGRRLSLVIADQSLGDLEGLDLLAQAKTRGARLILVTGRATNSVEAEAQRLGASVLWKPFRLHDLLQLLRTDDAE